MITNYIKVALRNLIKERLNSAINIAGLVIGISACLMLLQYTSFEDSYDSFLESKENVYRLALDLVNPSSRATEFQNAQTYYAVRSSVLQEIPEIQFASHLFSTSGIFDLGGTLFREEKIFYTASSFFDVLPFPVLKGNYRDLDEINTIFLSESTAIRFFGDRDPIGQKISFNSGLRNVMELEVRGVFKDFPQNSHLNARGLISQSTFESQIDQNQFFGPQLRLDDVRWRWMQFYTYIKIHPHVDPGALAVKLREFCHRYRKPYDEQQGRVSNIVMQPLESIHLDSNRSGEIEIPGSRKLNQFLFALALLTVAIAWINYINLTTAKAVNRGKEVGVRKVVGANQNQLRNQFLLEAFFMNSLALIVAIVTYLFLAPYANSLVGKDVWMQETFWSMDFLKVILFILAGSLVTGLYPALVLSAYKPIAVLKGNFGKSKSGVMLRRALVVFQFMIALFLLSGIYAINSQLGFMVNHDTGLNTERTLVIQRPPIPFNEPATQQKMEVFRNGLQQLAGTADVAVGGYMPGPEIFFRQTCFLADNSEKSLLLSRIGIDSNYLHFFGMEIKDGLGFTDDIAGAGQRVVVNEKLVSDFGYSSSKDILGKSILLPGGQAVEIMGVVEDFYHRGLRFPIEPMVLHLDSTSTGQFIAIRTKGNPSESLAAVKELYQSSFPNSLFEFTVLDETFQKIYSEDRRFRSIITLATVIAVVIACLGLLGLSSYVLNQRLKEISVRKVLGAKSGQLFNLLVREYVILAIIGVWLSLPLSYYSIDTWLNTYVSRVPIRAVMFIAPAFILVLFVLLTVGYQTIKATLVNPAECLKNE